MLTPIQTSGKQAEINTLNSLIRLYDQKNQTGGNRLCFWRKYILYLKQFL